MKVALRWDQLRDENPDAYLRTIVYRQHISWWRRRREALREVLPDRQVPDHAEATASAEVVRQALRLLTPKQRAVWFCATSRISLSARRRRYSESPSGRSKVKILQPCADCASGRQNLHRSWVRRSRHERRRCSRPTAARY